MTEYYSNFKRYLPDGRRCALFGRELDGKLEIFEIFCSKHDQFSKDLAKSVYNNYVYSSSGNTIVYLKSKTYHPKIHNIEIKKGDTAKYTFKKYCEENFYAKKTLEVTRNCIVDVLENENLGRITLKSSLKLLKRV